ncbi:hypothetical protein PIB30_013873 [Stylosanthes scabra]|uniref:Uncharacterized protein n=1 Tax=Stylosanthes scabra TaxID=79078 RepID=A0ABU6U5I6_9FABA|nr:hypothetical protein [Stylosanthes scabra]
MGKVTEKEEKREKKIDLAQYRSRPVDWYWVIFITESRVLVFHSLESRNTNTPHPRGESLPPLSHTNTANPNTETENPLDPSHRRSPPSWRLSSSPARRVKLQRSSLSHSGYRLWFPSFAVQRRSTTAVHACRQPSLPSPSIRCHRSTIKGESLPQCRHSH